MAILQLRGAALRAKPSISVPLKSTASALAGILLIPLLLPAVPFVLFSISSFGGVTASVSGQSSYTLSLFNVASVTQYAWALWICFVLFIIATIYIALRETARNMYDPYYAKWENTWKAPVAVMVFWLVAEFLCTNFLAGYSSNTVSTMVPMGYLPAIHICRCRRTCLLLLLMAMSYLKTVHRRKILAEAT